MQESDNFPRAAREFDSRRGDERPAIATVNDRPA
jgi:hypothetical protein